MVVEERDYLVDEFNGGTSFLLRFTDDIGVTALVCLDWASAIVIYLK